MRRRPQMSLTSIYEHMEKRCRKIPRGEKIILRHSIRKPIDMSKGMQADLTDEGGTLAKKFGKNLMLPIGFIVIV